MKPQMYFDDNYELESWERNSWMYRFLSNRLVFLDVYVITSMILICLVWIPAGRGFTNLEIEIECLLASNYILLRSTKPLSYQLHRDTLRVPATNQPTQASRKQQASESKRKQAQATRVLWIFPRKRRRQLMDGGKGTQATPQSQGRAHQQEKRKRATNNQYSYIQSSKRSTLS